MVAIGTQFDNGNSGSTLTIDWNSGNAQRVTLTAATVTLTLTNGKVGGSYVLECVQDGSGSRLITWAAGGGTAVIWPAGTTPISSEDFRFRRKCTPTKKSPGQTALSHSTWTGKPSSSKASGVFIQDR